MTSKCIGVRADYRSLFVGVEFLYNYTLLRSLASQRRHRGGELFPKLSFALFTVIPGVTAMKCHGTVSARAPYRFMTSHAVLKFQ